MNIYSKPIKSKHITDILYLLVRILQEGTIIRYKKVHKLQTSKIPQTQVDRYTIEIRVYKQILVHHICKPQTREICRKKEGEYT